MQKVQALLESVETKKLLSENKQLVESASQDMIGFYNLLTNYISENLVEFLDENLEETAKNIYTFAAYSTKQFLNEISALYGRNLHQAQVLKEAAKTEFV